MTLEKITYGGWKNCLKLSADGFELVVTIDVGPRVIRLGRSGGQNLFKEFDDQMGKTSGTDPHNVSHHSQEISIDLESLSLADVASFVDILRHKRYPVAGHQLKITIVPNEVLWLSS